MNIKNNIIFYILLIFITVLPNNIAADTIDVSIATGSDDAQENNSYSVDIQYSGIHLKSFADGINYNGFRFQNISIPNNATISNAFIQFTSDQAMNQDTITDVTIWGENADHTQTFEDESYNISGRTKTSANASWRIAENWDYNERGNNQRTPDLTNIVQEIVNRTGWSSGNAMTFILSSSQGYRAIKRYETSSTDTASLHIEYTVSADATPIAEYRFDECLWDETEGKVKDTSGNDHHGTAYNNALISEGKINNAGDFTDDGTNNSYVEFSSALTDVTVDNWSFSCWVKLKSSDEDWQPILFVPDNENSLYGIISLWYYSESDREAISLWVDNHNLDGSLVATNLSDNQWHFISVTYNGTNVKLNIDNNNITTSYNHESRTFSSTNDFYAGIGRSDAYYASNMYIDEVKVFDSTLNASQINDIYTNELAERNYDDDTDTRVEVSCGMPTPVADYRFDKCIWNGTTGEVQDSSGNEYHLSTKIGATTTTGKINNGGEFDGINGRVYGTWNQPFTTEVTLTAWIKTTDEPTAGDNYIRVVQFSNASDDHDKRTALDYNSNVQVIRGIIRNSNGTAKVMYDLQANDKHDGQWHFLAFTYDNGAMKLYVDNVEVASGNNDIGDIKNGKIISIAGRQKDSSNSYKGNIDEVKIFDVSLSSDQIQTIYENENTRKNYDDTHRMVIDCTTPILLAEYRFDECKYTGATGEVIDTQGGDNSGTITGDANLSKDEKKVGHALKLTGGAVDINNLAVATDIYKKNTVMFWMYWDGTNSIMPFGWNKYDLWISGNTMGFNTSSSDRYGLNITSLANGWHHITAIFTNGDVHSNQLYIDGTLQTLTQISNTPNNTRSYAQSSARIGGWLVNTGYRFKSHIDEVKIYKGEVDATVIESIYNSENTIIRNITCAQALLNAVNQNGGCFNWDNNITTKIAGNPINLTILSANENNTSISDINITKLELLSFSDPSCSTLYDTTEVWNDNQAVDANGCFNPPTFNHNKAIKCAKIKISGIQDGNAIESNSSDMFSIRPYKFILNNIPSGKLTSEHSYTFQAKAVNSNGSTTTSDFNTSITPTNKKYFRDDTDGSAMAGAFIPTTDFEFLNGTTTDTILSFNNVGKIGLELNDTTWTEVDRYDTTLVDRTIYLEHNLTFIPDRFDITFATLPTINNYNDGTFTYYSNDLVNMGATLKDLNFTITALGENGATMTNYQNPQTTYFANNTDFNLGLKMDQNPNISDINETLTRDLNFTTGIAKLNYGDLQFNYGRERNIAKNPITMNGSNSDINITATDHVDTTIRKELIQSFIGDATFYYGKIKTQDIKTADSPTEEELTVEVYWNGTDTRILPTTFTQNTASWYMNVDDDAISTLVDANFTAMKKRKIEIAQSVTTFAVNTPNPVDGEIGFTITKTDTTKSQKLFYHVQTPTWLWYSKYEDYDFATDTTCAKHPCFEYIFESEDETMGIRSGDFNGTRFENNFNSGIKKKAIKLMR